MGKIKLSVITYLNTKPFLYGITHSDLMNSVDLSLDIPSVCADKLKAGTADIGIIPVAEIPNIKGANIVTDFCIAASGKVRTVVLVSQVPLNEIKKIVLDYQSRTSVQLVRILVRDYWQFQPEWQNGGVNYIEEDIKGTTAGVIIGDRVFEYEDQFPYVYDLGEAWKALTGLDFVFACWVANKPIAASFVEKFAGALKLGIVHIPEVIDDYLLRYPDYPFESYFRENIFYHLDDSKRKGMELFLSRIKEVPKVPKVLKSRSKLLNNSSLISHLSYLISHIS
ncbi:MAG: menaquinone biosynthesis protein [Bacteroidetes bacterium]|nr:menaquinone biosynthesis protein [Bacteroidota bacterium]